MSYGVFRRCVVRRGNANAGCPPILDYKRDDSFGKFETSILAKRAIANIWYPELAKATDEHIKRLCKYHISGPDSDYKIKKVSK